MFPTHDRQGNIAVQRAVRIPLSRECGGRRGSAEATYSQWIRRTREGTSDIWERLGISIAYSREALPALCLAGSVYAFQELC